MNITLRQLRAFAVLSGVSSFTALRERLVGVGREHHAQSER